LLRKEKIQGRVETANDDPDGNGEIGTEKKQDTTTFLECGKKN
jgi:hypothetical protein